MNLYPIILVIYIIFMIILYIIVFIKIQFSLKSLEQRLYLINMLIFLSLVIFYVITISFQYNKIYSDKPIIWQILSPVFFFMREFYFSFPAILFQLIWQYSIIKKLYKLPFQNK
jgi:hypothetical protein